MRCTWSNVRVLPGNLDGEITVDFKFFIPFHFNTISNRIFEISREVWQQVKEGVEGSLYIYIMIAQKYGKSMNSALQLDKQTIH